MLIACDHTAAIGHRGRNVIEVLEIISWINRHLCPSVPLPVPYGGRMNIQQVHPHLEDAAQTYVHFFTYKAEAQLRLLTKAMRDPHCVSMLPNTFDNHWSPRSWSCDLFDLVCRTHTITQSADTRQHDHRHFGLEAALPQSPSGDPRTGLQLDLRTRNIPPT